METSESCIFCKIVKKEIPASIVYEDENSLAFLDINPVKAGHTLVIPKSHYPWMQETPDETVSKSFLLSKKLMSAIKEAIGADYIAVQVVGKDIPHFHIHLIPKWLDDNLHGWPTTKYKEREMEEVAEKIKSKI